MSYDADDIAVRVTNVTKVYKIFETPGQRFLYHMFHTKGGRDFVALDNVSFEVKKGESFGIIGKNGSGKSTMLQILAGIIKETSGKIEVRGRIAALLELGSGFNPESTGYENIYMNASILGASKNDIDAKVNQVIEFADIGEFINQPVKTYSSGMFVRLAFAVAVNVDADILLVDEALAVGDVFFRQKCYKRLNQLKDEGKTIILVSHGMNEVEQFCDRALLLNHSKQLKCGESREIVSIYYMLDEQGIMEDVHKKNEGSLKKSEARIRKKDNFEDWSIPENIIYNCPLNYETEVNSGKVRFLNIGIFNREGNPTKFFYQGEDAYFLYEIEVFCDIKIPIAGIVFYDQHNTIVFGKDNLQMYTEVPQNVKAGSIVRCLFKIKLDIAVGEYTFDVGFNEMDHDSYMSRAHKNQDEINSVIKRLCRIPKAGNFVIQEKKVGEPMKIMFHGCCDLPSVIQMIV